MSLAVYRFRLHTLSFSCRYLSDTTSLFYFYSFSGFSFNTPFNFSYKLCIKKNPPWELYHLIIIDLWLEHKDLNIRVLQTLQKSTTKLETYKTFLKIIEKKNVYIYVIYKAIIILLLLLLLWAKKVQRYVLK